MENNKVRAASVENLLPPVESSNLPKLDGRGGTERLAPVRRGLHEIAIEYTQTHVHKVSREHLRRNRVLTGKEPPHIANSYAMLRTQVLQRMAAQSWNALAVTSSAAGQGKTLTALNLAICLAREVHYTVLLVDLDLRRPSVHRYLGLTPNHGIGDYLLYDVPLQDILINPGMDRLVVLPGKHAVANSSEILTSPKTAHLVAELKSRYPSRIVIFDLPPVLSADDTLAFSPYTDAVLLVLEENKTTREEISRTINLLSGVNIIGTVLNKSQERLPDT